MTYLYSVIALASIAGALLLLFATWLTILNIKERRDAKRVLRELDTFITRLNLGEIHQEEFLQRKEPPYISLGGQP